MKRFLALLFLASLRCHADVTLPPLFGDHMVLQQEATLPIWGTAAPGERVRVSFGSRTAATVADAHGKWRVDLAPSPAFSNAMTLVVQGNNTLEFRDVLAGDVWVASGQSNMEFGIQMAQRAGEEIQKADQPRIRLFFVPKAAAFQPEETTGAAPRDNPLQGKWQVCTPETVARDGNWNGFSAVAYLFAREIQQSTGHAVGMIGSYWGGTPAQAWTSLSGLEGEPALAHYASDAKNQAADPNSPYPYNWAEYTQARDQWNEQYGKAYVTALQAWQEEANNAKKAGRAEPPKPPAPSKPQPRDPGFPNAPTTLFNGMIAPLIPYAIKGVIWYQGEANTNRAAEYRTLFARMISDWRQKWGEGNFPFLFVQLAAFEDGNPNENWPLLRESQSNALGLPATGMAVTIDIGDAQNIHPTDKLDVARRLALVAGHVAYGRNGVYSGPLCDRFSLQGNTIQASFSQAGGGLMIGMPPLDAAGKPAPGTELKGFTIAGADHHWVAAQARIWGNSVFLSSPQAPAPVAVRYAWANVPQATLYNQEGLPAAPFRSDDWPRSTEPDDSHSRQFSQWYKECADRVAAMKGKPCDILFIGDSITQNWADPGKTVWDKWYAGRNALNFGVGADTTGHVLWRLDNMDVRGFRPKVAVILIGTNNTEDSAADIAAGVKTVAARTQTLFPGVKIIIVSILPNARATQKMAEANKTIQTFEDGRSVFYFDLASKMTPVGDNWKGLGGDHLHPVAAGYELWASTMEPLLKQFLPLNYTNNP